jgi:membrane-associated phospholipid phosphatase
MTIDTIVEHFFLTLRTPTRTLFFNIVTMFADPKTILVFLLIIVAWLLYKKQKKLLYALVIGLTLSEGITYVSKIIFHRARPLHGLIVETDYSFPSGHATIAVVFYGFIAFFLLSYYKKSVSKVIIILLTTIGILLIGISRLYLGVHYLTDIIAGYAVGTLGLIVGLNFYKQCK